MPLQKTDPAKQAMLIAKERLLANTGQGNEPKQPMDVGETCVTLMPTTPDNTRDMVEETIPMVLRAGRGEIYNDTFQQKTDKDGNAYLNDTEAGFLAHRMADALIDKLDVRVFASRERPSVPKRAVVEIDGRFVNLSSVAPQYITYLTEKKVGEDKIKKVIYTIKNSAECYTWFEEMETNPRRANFLNGVVDITGDEVVLTHRTDSDIFFTRVPHNYPIDGGECPVFQEFLDYVLDPKYHDLIYEWIGYCFFETYEFQNILFHYGVGGSGKSTLLNLVSCVLGAHNISSVTLKQAAQKFILGNLDGALANHGSEVSYKDLKDGGEILKQLSSGTDPVLLEEKYEKSYTIINTAKLTYAMNNLPKMYTEDSGLMRRLILVDWARIMPKSIGIRFNSATEGMLTPEEISGVLYQSIKAFHAMVKRGEGFSYSRTAEETESDYAIESDTLGQFVYDRIEFSDVHSAAYRDGRDDWESNEDLYSAYTTWCELRGTKRMPYKVFINRHHFAKEMDITSAKAKRETHHGKQLRGYAHIKIVPDGNGIQTTI